MYRVLFLFFCILTAAVLPAHHALAQNLVPNGSFEEYDECPDWLDQFTNATGWQSWRGTPDFFHACDTTLHVGTPLNLSHGYQVPRTGDGYGGLIGLNEGGGREIMGIELSQPLVVGQEYYIEFYWNRTFGGWAHSLCDCAISHLGALLTTQGYHNVNNPVPIGNFAHVVDLNILADSTNWVKISGWAMADSAYTHIGIGNFFDFDSTETAFYNGTADELLLNTYYFIEDLCVAIDPAECGFLASAHGEDKLRLHLYPNPTSAVLNIRSSSFVEKIAVFDLTGKQMPVVLQDNYSLNVSHLSHGMYVIKIETNTGVHAGKFLKTP